eukprot:3708704-Prymnesium_polylepis.1
MEDVDGRRAALHLAVARLGASDEHLEPLLVRDRAAVLVVPKAVDPGVGAHLRARWWTWWRLPHARRQRVDPHSEPRARDELCWQAERRRGGRGGVADNLGRLRHLDRGEQPAVLQHCVDVGEAPRGRLGARRAFRNVLRLVEFFERAGVLSQHLLQMRVLRNFVPPLHDRVRPDA